MYARQKLKETEFFWGKFKESTLKTEEHAFYFSAFVSAFRSFTFVLQSQYKRYDGFDLLYAELLGYLGQNSFFSNLKDARNIALKQGARVPVLITRAKNTATGDVITYECDPIHDNEDIIRKVHVEMAYREKWLLPGDMPEDQRREHYCSQLWNVMKAFEGNDIQIERLIRAEPDGEAMPLSTFTQAIDEGVTFFKQILPAFESLAPKHDWFGTTGVTGD